MRIPTKFHLANRTFRVKWGEDEYMEAHGADGLMKLDKGLVLLRQGMSTEYTEHVFYHELAHAILEILGYDEDSDDERKVDQIGGILHQFLRTRKGYLRRRKGVNDV